MASSSQTRSYIINNDQRKHVAKISNQMLMELGTFTKNDLAVIWASSGSYIKGQNSDRVVRFEVFTAVTMKNAVFTLKMEAMKVYGGVNV
jgi:hypothetical protein